LTIHQEKAFNKDIERVKNMKLIATDLDGTLLNEKSEVSPENAKAIRKAQELGIEVVIATGRSYEAASKPLLAAGLSCPIICVNGAQIHLKNGELIRSIPLEKESCKKIELACTSESSYFEIFTSAGGYSVNRDAFIHILKKKYSNVSKMKRSKASMILMIFSTITTLLFISFLPFR
jgi:hydroxymethylpyrimidine pyrophosphatase-like HAD family hydrolase